MPAWLYFITVLLDFISTIWNLWLVISWNVIGGLTEKDANDLINNILIIMLINITCLSHMFFSASLFYCRCHPSLPVILCLSHTHSLSVSPLSCSLPCFFCLIWKPWHPFSAIIDCNKLFWFKSLFHSKVAHTIHNILLCWVLLCWLSLGGVLWR